jgi:hypothetical protein
MPPTAGAKECQAAEPRACPAQFWAPMVRSPLCPSRPGGNQGRPGRASHDHSQLPTLHPRAIKASPPGGPNGPALTALPQLPGRLSGRGPLQARTRPDHDEARRTAKRTSTSSKALDIKRFFRNVDLSRSLEAALRESASIKARHPVGDQGHRGVEPSVHEHRQR